MQEITTDVYIYIYIYIYIHHPTQAVTADSGSVDEAMEQKRALEEVCDQSWNVCMYQSPL